MQVITCNIFLGENLRIFQSSYESFYKRNELFKKGREKKQINFPCKKKKEIILKNKYCVSHNLVLLLNVSV